MHQYKKCFSDRSFVISVIMGFLFLAFSFVVQYFAGNYVDSVVSGNVTDVILSNTRVYEVGPIFIYGALLFFIFVFILCDTHPKYIPFVVKSVALFILTRALFTTLTHIGEFPSHAELLPGRFYLTQIFNPSDHALFFSGHTGLPLLMALIFWNHKTLRNIFLCTSVIFAAVVLLGHLHYSIDVFAAFFMAYGIFHIAKFIFKKDWKRLRS